MVLAPLVIETIDGLTTIVPAGHLDCWIFNGADEAREFINAWYSDDVRNIHRPVELF